MFEIMTGIDFHLIAYEFYYSELNATNHKELVLKVKNSKYMSQFKERLEIGLEQLPSNL